MLMKKVGNWVTDKPVIAIAVVVIITLLLLSTVFIKGLNTEFDEESFLPDIEMAKAETEIQSDFSREYSLPVLVKSNNGNVLTPASLLEILILEKELFNDPYLADKFEQPDKPQNNFNSIADQIIFIYLMTQSLEDLEVLNTNLELLNTSFYGINQVLADLSNQLDNIDTSNSTTTLDTFFYMNLTLANITGQIQDPQDALAYLGGGGQSDGNGHSDGMMLTFDQKIGIMSNMSEQELLELITDAFTYDGSTTLKIRTEYANFAVNAAESTVLAADLITQLTSLGSDPAFSNSTLYYNTTNSSTIGLDYIDVLKDYGDYLEYAAGGYADGFAAMDLNKSTIQFDSQFGFLGFGLTYLLTKDFQPQEGVFKAKGTLVLVYFNATVGEDTGGSEHSANEERK
jgi:hypothetical protein